MINAAAWIALALSFLTSVVTVTVFISAIQNSVKVLTGGQKELKDLIEPIKNALNDLKIIHAIGMEAAKELKDRVASIEDRLDAIDDDLMRCRSRIHLLANKLMEVDPGWRGLVGD